MSPLVIDNEEIDLRMSTEPLHPPRDHVIIHNAGFVTCQLGFDPAIGL